MITLSVSNGLLWIFCLTLGLINLALARQIGILYDRIAPMGALVMETGPKAGERSPVLTVNTVDGGVMSIGLPSAVNTLLFFMSPDCPVCKKLIPILRSFQTAERGDVEVVLASDGDAEQHLAFYSRASLAPMRYVLSGELGMKFRVGKLPYAVLIDQAGVVRARGLVNSREQLESLLTARELGVFSAQEFRAKASLRDDGVRTKEAKRARA